MKSCRAFTLIELLVAILVMFLMLALGYGALNQALDNRGAIEEQQARLVALQTTMRLFTQDFAQLVPRPVRDPIGTGWQAALLGDARQQPVVTLTRGGWANPAGIQRPALQRVSYVLENGTLRREHLPVLDSTLASQPVRRELLDGVRSIRFRYMDSRRQWRESWPPITTSGAPLVVLRMRPIAVEVTLELEDFGKLVRIIEVPS